MQKICKTSADSKKRGYGLEKYERRQSQNTAYATLENESKLLQKTKNYLTMSKEYN